MFNILTFTGFHTWLSLVALASGILLIVGMFEGRFAPRVSLLFFAAAIATNVTGFMFPFTAFLPSHGVDILSTLIILVALFARYARHLAGAWRGTYTVCTVLTVYFLAFVGIAQSFQKIPALASPTQTNFAIAQGVLLIVAIFLAVKLARGFRPTI